MCWRVPPSQYNGSGLAQPCGSRALTNYSFYVILDKMLNQRQELFCLNLVSGMSATDAAIQAGYSKDSARVNASRLLTNANIIQRNQELQELVQNDKIATVIERKETLTEIVRGRFGDFADSRGEMDVTQEALKSASLQEVKKIVVTGKDDYVRETTTVKLRDPIDAIRELNKMEGDYAPEKHAVLGDIEITIVHRDKE